MSNISNNVYIFTGPDPITQLTLNADSSILVNEKEIKLIRLANADLSDEESEEDT